MTGARTTLANVIGGEDGRVVRVEDACGEGDAGVKDGDSGGEDGDARGEEGSIEVRELEEKRCTISDRSS